MWPVYLEKTVMIFFLKSILAANCEGFWTTQMCFVSRVFSYCEPMVYEKDPSVYPVYLHCFGGGLASVPHVTQCMDIVELTIYGNDPRFTIPHCPKFLIPDMFDVFSIKTGEGLNQTCLEVVFGMSFSNSVIFLIPKNLEKELIATLNPDIRT